MNTRKSFRLLGWAAFAALSGSSVLHAQDVRFTATRQMRWQVFAAGSFDRPAYNNFQTSGFGGTVGTNLYRTVPSIYHLQPGFEIRSVFSHSEKFNETAYGGGPRVVYNFGAVQPYVDALVSFGTIRFLQPTDPNYLQDKTAVRSMGAGVDVLLSPNLALRTDFQRQHWQLSKKTAPFYPTQLSFGVRYQLHFGRATGPE